MIRGDNIVCGTSTTGTGTLTLAATPGPPGGVDFDVFARATGIGFGNSAAILVSYTIIEYTDSTFATAKAHEKGVGTLTLGGSSGIANCTLARTTKQTSATSLNSQPATQNIAPGTGISIGTAANTLVFIGASAADVPAYSPYVNTSLIGINLIPPCPLNANTSGAVTTTNNQDWFMPFTWAVPILVKKVILNVQATYTGQNNNLYVRLYDIGSNGSPGKLLADFGQIGTLNASFAATGYIATAALTNGFFMMPADYYLDILPVWTAGGTGTPGSILQWGTGGQGPIMVNRIGAAAQQAGSVFYSNTGSATTPDPAPALGGTQASTTMPWFALST